MSIYCIDVLTPHRSPLPRAPSCVFQEWGEEDHDDFDGDDEDEKLSARLTDILGADNLSCWGLIDQLIFMENAVTT